MATRVTFPAAAAAAAAAARRGAGAAQGRALQLPLGARGRTATRDTPSPSSAPRCTAAVPRPTAAVHPRPAAPPPAAAAQQAGTPRRKPSSSRARGAAAARLQIQRHGPTGCRARRGAEGVAQLLSAARLAGWPHPEAAELRNCSRSWPWTASRASSGSAPDRVAAPRPPSLLHCSRRLGRAWQAHWLLGDRRCQSARPGCGYCRCRHGPTGACAATVS
mmetsp:Transcript_9499/g.22479  ORF Transcript_9499/g.22479 Transcript_9499/m.22479 type:complete len:219 (+) Transcript_9499:551-1207(+)